MSSAGLPNSCVTNQQNAGRLVDYFAVIGFDDAEEKRNGQSVGKLIQRFPETDWPDVPFIRNLEIFCQPQGWCLSSRRENPKYFVSVLTDIQRDRHYAACLTFSEPRFPSESLTEYEDTEEAYSALSADTASLPILYAPKCLVLVSRLPFTENFRNCLGTIYTVYIEKMSVELESLIANLFAVRVFPPGTSVSLQKFSLGAGDRQAVQTHNSPSIPLTYTSVALLFQQLGIYNVICLFCTVLTDKKILFHSQSYSRLTEACHAISSLIYPLKNTHVYIPIVPSSLLQVLHSPVPLMIGVHSDDRTNPEFADVLDMVIVDLDSGSVYIPECLPVPPIPEPYHSRLLTSLTLVLNSQLYSADHAFSPTPPPPPHHHLPLIDKQIRACFIRLFADLLCDYRICLQIVRLHPSPFITFHRAAFLGLRGLQEDEFMKLLLGSMSFEAFISERGLPFRVCDLFDEVYGSMQRTLTEEKSARTKLLDNIQALALQLLANEDPATIGDGISKESSSKLFPNATQQMLDALESKLNILPPIIGSGPARRQVPVVLTSARNRFSVTGANIRRLDVLKNCLRSIFDNKISESRKMLSAVLLSMKSQVVRVAFCQELYNNLHPHNRATLEAQQFDLIVKLMNCALQRLTQGVHQFAYTCIQEHAVWQNLQFWEAAFYHDVHQQLKILHSTHDTSSSPQTTFNKAPFGKGMTRDTWNLYEEPLGLQVACEKMKSMERITPELMSELEKTETEIVYSQAIHYTNLMVCLRVPMDATRLRRVNVKGLENRSVAGSHVTTISGEDDNSEESSSESDGESGFMDMVDHGDGDLGYGTVRWISKFIDKVCSEASLTPSRLLLIHQRIPGFVAIHIENLEQVHRESKRLPPIHKPKMLMPAFLPREQMLQGYLRVFLLSDGRGVPGVDTSSSLLPAEGAIFLTNYRVIFKGQPCDPYICEQVVIRTMPVMSVTKEKRIGQQVVTGTEQTSHHLHDALQIRSSTFQLFKIAFDEEVTTDKVENFVSSLEQIRWPESVLELYAMSGEEHSHTGLPVPGHAHKSKSINKTIGRKLNQTLIRLGGGGGRKEDVFQSGPRGRLASHRLTHDLAAIDEGENANTLTPEDNNGRSGTLSRNLEKLSDRDYCRDFLRLGLCSKAEVTMYIGSIAVGGSLKSPPTNQRSTGFRLSTANRFYGLCRSYPAVLVVPSKVTDDSLKKIAKGYKHSRLPTVTWCSARGALLLRGAGFNPKTLLGKMKKQTEGLSSAMSGGEGVAKGVEVMKSSVEQERYLTLLTSLSPANCGLHRTSSHLMSSVGSLLSLDSLMLANLDGASTGSNTPEIRQKNTKASVPPYNMGQHIQRTADFVRSSRGKSSTITSLRPGHQRRGSTSSTLSTPSARGGKRGSAVDLRLKDMDAPQTLVRASLYIFGEKTHAKALKLDSRCHFIPITYPTSREVKDGLKKFLRLAAPSTHFSEYSHLRTLDNSGWLNIVRNLLRISSAVVDLIDIQNSSVALCMEDGWDVTSQLSSLSQIMLDGEYRTMEGFRTLVEKEWLGFGHRFSHRHNHTHSAANSGVAPHFLLFLDAVHQLHRQNPGAFEFNDFFLRFLAFHSTAAYFNTFLFDSEAERLEAGILHYDRTKHRSDFFDEESKGLKGEGGGWRKTGSVWECIEERQKRSPLFHNFLYSPGGQGVIRPQFSIAAMHLWDYYLEDSISVGSVYDLEAGEKEWAERETEGEMGGVGGKSERRVVDLNYHSADLLLHSAYQQILSEIHALEKDMDLLPHQWSDVLATARKTADKQMAQEGNENNGVGEWGRWINRALHKKSTIELLLRSRNSARNLNRMSNTGDNTSQGSQQHSFLRYNPTAPEHCSVCNRIVWGVVKPGLRCTNCDYTCHEKCSQLALSNCQVSVSEVNNSSVGPSLKQLPEETGEDFPPVMSYSENRTHEGYLHKRGALLKGWKCRWFVLDSMKHQLRYFDSMEDRYCKGWIDLSEVTVIMLAQGSPSDGSCFDVKTTKRVYNFMSNSPKEAQEWIEKIQSCLGE